MNDQDTEHQDDTAEVEARRDAALRRALMTPPKPHHESKISTAQAPLGKDQGLTKNANGDSVEKLEKKPRRSGTSSSGGRT
jgi:hypothetical protein